MVNQSITVDRIYAALGDPTRRSMVEQLRRGPLSVSALAAPHGMTLAGVGKHVGVLEAAGIVHTVKLGRVRECALVEGALDDAAEWIDQTRRFWNARLDRLVDHLEEES